MMEVLATCALLDVASRRLVAIASITPHAIDCDQAFANISTDVPQAKQTQACFSTASHLGFVSVSGASRETLLVMAEGVRGLARRSEFKAAVDAQQGRSTKGSSVLSCMYAVLCCCLKDVLSASRGTEMEGPRSCAACANVVAQLPPSDRAGARAVLSALEASAAAQPARSSRPCPSILQLLLRSAAAEHPLRSAGPAYSAGDWTVDRIHAEVLRRARLCAPGESWLVPLSVDVTVPAAAAGLPGGLSAGAAAAALPRLRRLFLWDACDDGAFSPLHMAAVAVREADLPPALAIAAANDMVRQLLAFRDSLKPEQTALRAALARAFARVAMLQQSARALERAGAALHVAEAAGSAPADADAAVPSAVAVPASALERDAAAMRSVCTVPLPDLLHLPPLLLPQAAASAGADQSASVSASAGPLPAAARAPAVIRSADLFIADGPATALAPLSSTAAEASGSAAHLSTQAASAVATAALPTATAPASTPLPLAAAPASPGGVELTRFTSVDPTGRPPWAPAVVSPPQLIAAWLTAREIDLTHTPVQHFAAAGRALSGAGAGAGADAGAPKLSLPLRPVCHCFAKFPIDVTAEGEVAEAEAEADTEAATAMHAGRKAPDAAAAGAGSVSSVMKTEASSVGVGVRRPRPVPHPHPRTALRAWRWRDSVRLPLAELLPGPMREALPPCEVCGAVRACSSSAGMAGAGASSSSGGSELPSAIAASSVASPRGLSSPSIGNPIVRYADSLALSQQLPARMHAPVVAALAGAVNGFLADIASMRVAAMAASAPAPKTSTSTTTELQAPTTSSIAGGGVGAAAKRRRTADSDAGADAGAGAHTAAQPAAQPADSGAPAGQAASSTTSAAPPSAPVSIAFRGLEAAIPASTDVSAWVGSDGIPCLAVAGVPLELL